MFANKSILLTFLIWGLVVTSCVATITPTAQPERTALPTQQGTTSTVFIGIPPISTPLIQSENESVVEFIVRIASVKISSERPLLIALSQLKDSDNLWFGVSPEIKDLGKCWVYDADSMRQCSNQDIQNNLGDQQIPKILFAFAYSNSTQDLFILDYYHPWVEQGLIDGYRLVIEFKDEKWVEKSLTSVY